MPGPPPSDKDPHIVDQWVDAQGVDHAIVDVWSNNVEAEMDSILELIEKYPYIAMDTEFPGEVYTASSTNSSGYATYDKVRANVDQLKLIQLGITLSTKDGVLPPGKCSWQFNFEFDQETDRINQESLTLLSNSGFLFDNHKVKGIDSFHFAEIMTTSGLVLNDNMTWVTFQAGYDFAYLLKMVTGRNLPSKLPEFNAQLKEWFPRVYDIRILTNRKGSLNALADSFEIVRHGIKHQAGSDSLITSETFFRVVDQRFHNKLDDSMYLNRIAGIDDDFDNYAYSQSKPFNPKQHFQPPQVPPASAASTASFNPAHSIPRQGIAYGYSPAQMFIPQHNIPSQQYMPMMATQHPYNQYGYPPMSQPPYQNTQMPM
ncbi:putative CCR4-NOT transcription complex subunit 8 [Blattamonas nauphoetae]|uniref:poly(A)-specific ribonuclease n=1 Tax=Blattamonas nauphoetae TaxID=2049346 RepID=A0ABQ9YG40_9EUKA|nr:putative CCR4-NOT transcription complex subunit 8 [Blattamonas nauphoetae]